MKYTPYGFDLRAVGELLDGVHVLCVVLQQDGHLEGGGLQSVPGDTQQHLSGGSTDLESASCLVSLNKVTETSVPGH